MAFKSAFADWIGRVGKTVNLPEMGISEALGGTKPTVFNPNLYGTGQGGTYAQGTPVRHDNPDVAGAPSTYDPTLAGGGATGGTSGGTTTAGVNLDPYKQEVQARLGKLNSLYDQLFGDVDAQVNERKGEIDANYGKQFGDLDMAYERTQRELPGLYSARGLESSSYKDNALVDAANTYTSERDATARDRDSKYGQLGQYASSQKAAFGAGKASLGGIDLNAFTPDDDGIAGLTQLRSQLDQRLGELTQQRAGMGTNAAYTEQVKGLAPRQQQGTGKLAQQLQTLITSSASQFAKDQIAQGLIRSSSLNDPEAEKYWQSFYNNLLTSRQSTAV